MLKLQIKRAESTSFSILPYVAIVGNLVNNNSEDNLANEQAENTPLQIFIFIESYECIISSDDLVEAVNYCFKSIFCLYKEWPTECKHIYEFLQQYVFQIEQRNVKGYIIVKKLISDIDALKAST